MESMACILKRHQLVHLTEVFQREIITPDIISHLSVHEMNQLGVNNRGDMMNLRMECSTYGKRKPQREVLGCGASSFNKLKKVPYMRADPPNKLTVLSMFVWNLSFFGRLAQH